MSGWTERSKAARRSGPYEAGDPGLEPGTSAGRSVRIGGKGMPRRAARDLRRAAHLHRDQARQPGWVRTLIRLRDGVELLRFTEHAASLPANRPVLWRQRGLPVEHDALEPRQLRRHRDRGAMPASSATEPSHVARGGGAARRAGHSPGRRVSRYVAAAPITTPAAKTGARRLGLGASTKPSTSAAIGP